MEIKLIGVALKEDIRPIFAECILYAETFEGVLSLK